MAKMIVGAKQAYEWAYDNFGKKKFPSDWYISENFTWNEVFTNEVLSDGIPTYDTFYNAVAMAKPLQALRKFLNKPINVHCWVRQIPHNKRAGSTAKYSAHINGRAVDFSIPGLSEDKIRATVIGLGLKVRIERGTKGWVHLDIGNTYTSDFTWGYF